MNHATVLILSTNAAFAREVANHWPSGFDSPEFTVLEQRLFSGDSESQYDLAIGDGSSSESYFELKRAMAASGKPAILIHTDSALPLSHCEGSIVELRGQDGFWSVIAGLVGREILRRVRSESRAREAESLCSAAQAEATLGRYILEMHHNVNNALTSVLGNAELLASEPGLSAAVLAQADTIRNMALRLHEVFQRLSSLEKELSVVARESGKNASQSRAAGAK